MEAIIYQNTAAAAHTRRFNHSKALSTSFKPPCLMFGSQPGSQLNIASWNTRGFWTVLFSSVDEYYQG